MPLKLFVIYIGGAHEKSLIELHDMRFVVADTIENTYPCLQESWWGTPESLHLDAWGVLEQADGYDLHLKDTPSDGEQQLYFVNLGGYDTRLFTELHQNLFVVARNNAEAKMKAKMQITHWKAPHEDYKYQIDDVVNINKILAHSKHYIHLAPSEQKKPFEFICQYTPIGGEV